MKPNQKHLFLFAPLLLLISGTPIWPLGPNADMPVIPGPAGSGLLGLQKSIESERIEKNQNISEVQNIEKRDEPEIRIPEPLSIKKETKNSKQKWITHSQKSNNENADDSNKLKNQTKKRTSKKKQEVTDAVENKDTEKTKRFSGFPASLKPTPKINFKHEAPEFYKGVYINQGTLRSKNKWDSILTTAKKYGMNSLVIDIQPQMPKAEMIQDAKDKGFYVVGRIVVFEGGLKNYPPSLEHLDRIKRTAELAAKSGFMEIQLDYIRFADRLQIQKLPLQERYRLISGILKIITDTVRPYGVRIGADIFGRIAFNNDDSIGQKLEVFSPHLDTIYPMLYPSHFYGDPSRMSNPYKTILDGTNNCVKRVNGNSKIIAYIQGFKMNVGKSGLSYTEYIRKQIQAAEDAGGAGYIVWNASNQYDVFFNALKIQNSVARRDIHETESGNTR